MNQRAKRLVRARIKSSGRYSVRIFLSNQHTYAQIVNPQGIVLTAVSSRSKELIDLKLKSYSNIEAAQQVGTVLGKKIVSMGLHDKIAYDRSGKQYHGRVATIAEWARKEGVNF